MAAKYPANECFRILFGKTLYFFLLMAENCIA